MTSYEFDNAVVLVVAENADDAREKVELFAADANSRTKGIYLDIREGEPVEVGKDARP